MSEKESKQQDEQSESKPRVRKRVQLIEEPVPEKPPVSEALAGAADATQAGEGQGDGEFTTEHAAGGKVRVARSAEMPEPQPRGDKPMRRAVILEKPAPKPADATVPGAVPDAAKPAAAKPAGAKSARPDKARLRDQRRNEEDASGQSEATRGPRQFVAPADQVSRPSRRPEPIAIDLGPVPDVSTDDFAALLAGEGAAGEPSKTWVSQGDQIDATVVAVGEKFVFVEFGSSKSEGIVKIDDVKNEEGEIAVVPGDALNLFVLSTSGGEIRLGKKLTGQEGAMDAIQTAYDTGMPIEGRVVATNKGGFEIAIGVVRAFCPMSQIELEYTEDPDVHIGHTYRFRVSKIAEEGRNIVVSRSALLEEERAQRRRETLGSLEVGQVVSGVVTRTTDFGAFVDIGGLEGLVHISELSHGAVARTTDVVKNGDQIEVKILSVEEQKRGDLRIGLSIRATQENPWQTVNERFAVGQQVEGTVVRIAPFGAFVEIAPGIDGLVHVSEMSWKKHVKHPQDVVTQGERVQVQIQEIDLVRQRVGLSMKAVEGDPWDSAEQRYTVGAEVSGEVENVQDFGAFVRIEEGITALLPRSEMDLPSGSTPQRKYSAGQSVTARVFSVDAIARKMALTEKAAADIEASAPTAHTDDKPARAPRPEVEPRSYVEQKSSTLGSFGDLLAGKLKKD